MPTYDDLKTLASTRGCRVTDLIALAPQNDPFYVGKPSDLVLGQWFATLWHRLGFRQGVHIRRVHYQIISQNPPVKLPNGTPYVNTESCWDTLNQAAKMARYLELVDPAAFVDRRNPDPVLYTSHDTSQPAIYTDDRLWTLPSLPDFPALPRYQVYGYAPQQRYHMEIWCEKSTVNDVLLPLCEQYGANLQTGLGELSITATLAVARRIEASGKPARIFYVSDFDPAGRSMPVAVARKVEYFVDRLGLAVDVRLFPVVLSVEQVQAYRLPRTPIKETERRAGRFEDRYGVGAVELDALEALHPGELERLLSAEMDRYYDATLDEQARQVQEQLEADLNEIRLAIVADHQDAIAALEADYAQIRADFSARMADHNQRLQRLWQRLTAEMDAQVLDVSDYPLPQPAEADELEEGLYNSTRDYLAQIAEYKAFQGRA